MAGKPFREVVSKCRHEQHLGTVRQLGEIRSTMTFFPINWDTASFSSSLDYSKMQTVTETHWGCV